MVERPGEHLTADGAATAMLQTILDSTPVGVCITTEDGIFEQVNPAYCRLYGYTAEELIGRPFTMIVPPEDTDQLAALHRAFVDDGAEIRGEWPVLLKDGTRKQILADACRVVAPDGRYRKVTFVLDITERKRLESELIRANEILADLARHDPLTNLANHRHTHELLGAAVETAHRHGRDLSVAALDLDHFKRINDRYGHRIGDEVLVGFAALMRAAVRAPDTVGRMGGEEFLMILPDTSVADAVGLLDRIRHTCEAEPVSSARIVVSFSAGLAGFAEGDQAQSLVDRADDALYQAKEQGRGRTVLG